MSAVGTILFIAQGGMRAKPEMKPWVHTDKNRMSSAGAALTAQAFALRFGSAAPLGLNKCVSIINPGLAPWAMKKYRPVGAHCPTVPIPPIPQTIQSQSYKNTNKRNNPFTHPNTFYEHNITTQHRKRPIRQRALQGRHSCKAQGEMRAKPDMKPWGNSKQQN